MQESRDNLTRRQTLALAGLGLAAVSLAACSGASAGPQPNAGADTSINDEGRLAQPTKMKIALPSKAATFTDTLLADEMGEFKKRNLDVEFKTMKSSDALVLLTQGGIDVVLTGPSAGLLNAISSGAGLRMGGPGSTEAPFKKGGWTTGWYASTAAMGGNEFRPEMLKGKTLTASQGASGLVVLGLYDVLKSAGMSFKDVTIKVMGAADTTVVLENGSVFGGQVAESGTPLLRAKNSAYQFAPTTRPGYPASVTVLGPNLVETNPDVAKAFYSAILATRSQMPDDIIGDPKFGPMVSKVLDIPLATLRDIGSFQSFPVDAKFPDNYVETYQDIWGQVPETLSYTQPLSSKDVIDTTALDWALERQ